MDLEQLVRWSGLIISAAGAALVSPRATRHWVATVRAALSRSWDQLLLALRIRRPRIVHLGAAAHGSGGGAFDFSGSARGHAWSDSDSVEEKIARLLSRVNELDSRISQVDQDLKASRAEHRQQLEQTKAALTAELDAIRRRLDTAEAAATEENSRALPVIVGGIVLSGLSQELDHAWWTAYPAILVAAFLTGRAFAHSFRLSVPDPGP